MKPLRYERNKGLLQWRAARWQPSSKRGTNNQPSQRNECDQQNDEGHRPKGIDDRAENAVCPEVFSQPTLTSDHKGKSERQASDQRNKSAANVISSVSQMALIKSSIITSDIAKNLHMGVGRSQTGLYVFGEHDILRRQGQKEAGHRLILNMLKPALDEFAPF